MKMDFAIGYSSRQGAKAPSSEKSLFFLLSLRLCAFAGDIPKSFFAPVALFAANLLLIELQPNFLALPRL